MGRDSVLHKTDKISVLMELTGGRQTDKSILRDADKFYEGNRHRTEIDNDRLEKASSKMWH